MNYITRVTLSALLLAGFSTQAQPKPQDGFWRGTFAVANGNEAPFNFELKGPTAWLLNGSERFELKGVTQKGDSLFLPVDIYDAVLKAKIENGKALSGIFKRLNTATPDPGIPFRAEFGQRYRFTEKPAAASVSLQGKWDVTIGKTGTVGVFSQTGSKITGTFLTTTGDYRYLEGSVEGDEFALSAFSGSSPSLIKGKISGNELTAEWITARGVQPVKGTRNAQAALPDAYTLTKSKDGVPFNFTFPDAFTGKPVSLNDPKYKGKVVVVTILGSWCPNCLDETAFLAPWFRANRRRGVEIIGLAFERKNDPAFAKTRLEALKKRFGVEYDLLFAGQADKQYASSVLPALSEVLSFPTTIYINRQGEVTKIHTGYTGPATGAYYEEFVKEFNADLDQLLKEGPAKASIRTSGK
ncbi:peroxiredoxin family protein [Larkinella knui]|uniref:TlpA family protein disulfide reductase n=1 Tax=Larkinella knui TaxID=2025310 RepID=A0A3P1CGZ1_9BACT|nr:TlpA disulfide reductase family protein [Larkinella knui]RRB12611.1 TlpA family protein disulfide reductase [Larkinella knui]